MKSISMMNIGELAAFVCSHLESKGIKVTLSGGACVSIYSRNKYQSFDLDFIEHFSIKRSQLRTILEEIKFVEKGRYFVNHETEFFLEFPPGPLSIGDEPVQKIDILQFETGKLHLLSPTDCVKDRLAGYYHWNDMQCLEQAILVSHDAKVDYHEIERWSRKEGKLAEYKRIKKKLASNDRDKKNE
jgi:hypothetical protein